MLQLRSPVFLRLNATRLFAHQAALPAKTMPPKAGKALAGNPPIVEADEGTVRINWQNKESSKFHHIWLADHCRCPRCFHAITKQRLVDTYKIPVDVRPSRVTSTKDGLKLAWPGAEMHESMYPWNWLRNHSYNPILVDRSPPIRTLWGAEIAHSPPEVSYEAVMRPDDAGLYEWLSKIRRYGFCFVSGVPVSTDATEELSTRIGFIRETQYGKFWEFTSDLTKGDTAYTTLALGAHTDNTYFTDPCGIQLFHLLSHTDGSGGLTLLVDGFHAAAQIQDSDPANYDALSNVKISGHAAGEPDELYRPYPHTGYPVLGHDVSGNLVQVRWNNDDRSVVDAVQGDRILAWYDAMRCWNRHITDPKNEYWVQLRPGTAVAVDNHRVLHGRSAFSGKRRMCGAYIGGDEYRSKLAVLEETYAPHAEADASGKSKAEGRSVWHPYL